MQTFFNQITDTLLKIYKKYVPLVDIESVDGLVPDNNINALAMEILQFCTKPPKGSQKLPIFQETRKQVILSFSNIELIIMVANASAAILHKAVQCITKQLVIPGLHDLWFIETCIVVLRNVAYYKRKPKWSTNKEVYTFYIWLRVSALAIELLQYCAKPSI